MDTATAQILVLGSCVIAFGAFASWMAERQAAAEAREKKAKSNAMELISIL